jgi:ubiquinone biosynthesis protein UbiJ
LSLLLSPIEFALNKALEQDGETQAKLVSFDQRRIAVIINNIDTTLAIFFNKQKLELSNDTPDSADLIISGDAFTLAKLGSDPESLFSAEIDINGDVQFAKQLKDLLEGFDFDWEAQLAKFTGDTLAYPIAHSLKQAGSWIKTTHQSLQLSTVEYLKEEAQLLPDKSQIKDYLNAIDTLRADFDRLEARINRL